MEREREPMQVSTVFTPMATGYDHRDHDWDRGERWHQHHGHHRGHYTWDWRNRRRDWCWDD
jgi:transposase-like protein